MSSKQKKIIGIDLGTTNSCVSVILNGKPEVVENLEGRRTTPSVVYSAKDGSTTAKFTVGASAQRNSAKYPDRVFYEFKRYIGKRYSELGEQGQIPTPFNVSKDDKDRIILSTNDGEKLSAEQLSGKVLKYLVDCVKEKYGHELEVDQVVITVPAYFNNAQREATKQAAEIEGIKVARIINEPTAAALSYGFQSKKSGKIAVFDLGGGTFDISILEKTNDGTGDSLDVLSTDGVDHLGGADFDNEIVNYVVEEFKKEHGVDLTQHNTSLARVKEAAEIAKKNLSQSINTEISLPFIYQQHSFEITLTRAKFEKLIAQHLEKVVKPCMDALREAKCLEEVNGKTVCTVDEILLVGGSTRVPCVYEKVKEIFGKEPQRGVNPDEAVAMGAAVQGGILQGDQDVGDILLVDVTPLTLGIETAGGVFHRLIDKNTSIPTKKSQIYTTATDNQPSVVIKVYQGERDIAEHNKLLSQFVLDNIPPAPRGVPQIEVAFDIDANGILSVSAKDVNTGKENKVVIKDSTQMSKEEIEKMQEEAKKHAEEDKKKKERIDKINQADTLVYTAENTLKKQEGLSEEIKNEIEDKIKKLKDYLETKDMDMDTLDQHTNELSTALQKSYDDISKNKGNNADASSEGNTNSAAKAPDDSSTDQ